MDNIYRYKYNSHHIFIPVRLQNNSIWFRHVKPTCNFILTHFFKEIDVNAQTHSNLIEWLKERQKTNPPKGDYGEQHISDERFFDASNWLATYETQQCCSIL